MAEGLTVSDVARHYGTLGRTRHLAPVVTARKTAADRDNRRLLDRHVLPSVPDVKIWKDLQLKRDLPGRLRAPNLERREDVFERIEKQMRELQERIEQLEKERGKNSEHEDDKSKEKALEEQEAADSQAPGEEKI